MTYVTMDANNTNDLHPKEFILTGFPGIEDKQRWLSVPFFIIYIVGLAGNTVTLLIIKTEKSLHEPMYLFIFMLAFVDIVLVISALTKLLAILWFDAKTITFETCIIQMFIVHFFTGFSASLLVVMAFDRYIAVCNPLRYPNIVTNKFIAIAVAIAIIRPLGLLLPLPLFAVGFSYCRTNVIDHCYCEMFALINIACANLELSVLYLNWLFIVMTMPDMALVGLSYCLILSVILKMKTKEARQKAFSTCSSHFSVILTFHALSIVSFVLTNALPYLRVMASVLFVVIPAALNPFIYCLNIKRIREKIKKVFNSKVILLCDR
ncbi:olfactory receptor 52E8-like [Protopterus annectens]|uniref:olfactory receptor 52E8-like n=1 Tax=Protopterus annectens TaxID=7888 RepID=UPI001CFBDBD2|nr:olfactory receptor 52E8-like [Protopterus annectens]